MGHTDPEIVDAIKKIRLDKLDPQEVVIIYLDKIAAQKAVKKIRDITENKCVDIETYGARKNKGGKYYEIAVNNVNISTTKLWRIANHLGEAIEAIISYDKENTHKYDPYYEVHECTGYTLKEKEVIFKR